MRTGAKYAVRRFNMGTLKMRKASQKEQIDIRKIIVEHLAKVFSKLSRHSCVNPRQCIS